MVLLPVAIGSRLEGAAAPVRRCAQPLARARRGGRVVVVVVARPRSAIPRGTSGTGRRRRSRRRACELRSPARASSRPTATPTGCSGRSRSYAGASRTTCASRSTSPSSSTAWFLPQRGRRELEEPRGRLSRRRRRRAGAESHTADFLAEPGARRLYRDDKVTVILRPTSSRPFDPSEGRARIRPARCEARAEPSPRRSRS